MKTFLAIFLTLFAVNLPAQISVSGNVALSGTVDLNTGGGGGGGATYKGVVEGSTAALSIDWDVPGTLNVATGDLIVLGFGGTHGLTTVSIDSGTQQFTKINSETASGYTVETWYLSNATASASAVVHLNSSASPDYVAAAAANYSGVTLYNPVDQSSCNSAGCDTIGDTPTAKTAQNVTTTSANALLFYWLVDDATQTSHVGANGYTVRTSTGSKNWALADKVVSSTGTYPSGEVVTTSDHPSDDTYWSLFVAFKAP